MNGCNHLHFSWAEVEIGDVAEVKGGKRLPKGKSLLEIPTAHPYIRVTDFDYGSVDISNLKYLDEVTHDAIKNYTISKDDLYISIAGTIGLVGEIPVELDGANLTENAAKLCGLSGIEKSYLRYVLSSNASKEQFDDSTTSSGQPKLALFRIKNCRFPLPPLAEQKVIADKLDTLLAQVETTKARLDRIPKILKTFRQSVLAAAVSGKLTEEWREKNDASAWQQKILGDVVTGISQGWSPKCLSEGTSDTSWGVIKTSSVQEIQFLEQENKKLPDNLEPREALKVEVGDILTTRAGPRSRCGVTCYVENLSLNLMICDKVYRYKAKTEIGHSKFLVMQLNSHPTLENIESLKTGISESGMNLTQKKFKALPLKWPSKEEQTQIVHRVEELFAFADRIEQKANAALDRVNSLTQSILAKAFRGELTADWRAQNPDLISGENSAEAFLEKIKAEREALSSKKKPKKKIAARKKA